MCECVSRILLFTAIWIKVSTCVKRCCRYSLFPHKHLIWYFDGMMVTQAMQFHQIPSRWLLFPSKICFVPFIQFLNGCTMHQHHHQHHRQSIMFTQLLIHDQRQWTIKHFRLLKQRIIITYIIRKKERENSQYLRNFVCLVKFFKLCHVNKKFDRWTCLYITGGMCVNW